MASIAVQEFGFTDRDFRRIQSLLKARAGIDLGDAKEALVYGRLTRRLRALGLTTFQDYLAVVEDEGSNEAVEFVNSLTTNVTAFFREQHHFDVLARSVLPELWKKHEGDRRVRLWSAGCSTGQEPYSLAMVVLESLPPRGQWDVKILATDLDSQVLAHARTAVYDADPARQSIPAARLQRWCEQGTGANAGKVRMGVELRNLITFKQLNLLEAWPMRGPFDIIFCRNVIIYFDEETKTRLMDRYRALLAPSGFLFLGHSETLVGSTIGFEPHDKTVYRKTTGGRS
jgi:chemotaxis protein methyltransferase CheR